MKDYSVDELVDSPDHYNVTSKEVWEMMHSVWGREAFVAHCEMCAFKYRMRLGLKPDQSVERDLAKARWYEDKANELREMIEEQDIAKEL